MTDTRPEEVGSPSDAERFLADGASLESLGGLDEDKLLGLLRQPVVEILRGNAPLLELINVRWLSLWSRANETRTLTDETPCDHAREIALRDDLHELQQRLEPSQQPDELARISGYRILRVIGAGGMGVVFEAQDLTLLRPVAIKVIRPRRLSRPDATSRFLAEARAAARLTNDHIVTVHWVGNHGETPFLVMQLLQGESLASRLRRDGAMEPTVALQLARQIAEGLRAAHAAGLIHGDIKPDNIWLEAPHDRVKILDFGLAHLQAGAGETPSGQVLGGTPHYIPPERLQGQVGDGRSDVFSLGVVLHEMLAGHRPAAEAVGAENSVRSKVPHLPAIRLGRSELTGEVHQLVRQLLDHELQKRPQAEAVVAEIDALLHRAARSSDRWRSRARWLALLAVCLFGLVSFSAWWDWFRLPLLQLQAGPGAHNSVDDLQFDLRNVETGQLHQLPLGALRLPAGTYQFLPTGIPGLHIVPEFLDLRSGRTARAVVHYEPDLTTNTDVRPTARLIEPHVDWIGIESWSWETAAHRGIVTGIALSPSGRWLASSGQDGTVRIWSAEQAALQQIWHGHDEPVTGLAWSPGVDHYLVSSSRTKLIVWDLRQRRAIQSVRVETPTRVLRWAPDATHLLRLDEQGQGTLYRCPDLAQVAEFPDAVTGAWSDQALYLVHQDGTGELRSSVDWTSSTPLNWQLPAAAPAALAPERAAAVFHAMTTLSCRDLETGTELIVPPMPFGEPWATWAIDDRRWLTIWRRPADYVFAIWQAGAEGVERSWTLPLNPLGLPCLSWNSDQDFGFVWFPALAAAPDLLRLDSQLSAPTQHRLSFGIAAGLGTEGTGFDDFRYNSDGSRLAVTWGVLDLWNASVGQYLQEGRGFPGLARFVWWIGNSTRLALDTTFADRDDRNLYLLDPERGPAATTVIPPLSDDLALRSARTLSADGRWYWFSQGDAARLTSTESPETIRPWSTALGAHEKITARAIASDGTLAWAVTDTSSGRCRLWIAPPSAAQQEFELPARLEQLAWSPAVDVVLGLTTDDRALAFSATSGERLDWLCLRQPVRGCAWSPTGSHLAVITVANHCLVWDLATDRLAAQFPVAAGRYPNLQWVPQQYAVTFRGSQSELITVDAHNGQRLATMFGLPDRQVFWVQSNERLGHSVAGLATDDPLWIWLQDEQGGQTALPRLVHFEENGHYYEFVPASRIDWTAAFEQAAKHQLTLRDGRRWQGYLANITSAEEQAFLESRFAPLREIWLGGTDRAEEETWRWISGPEGKMDGSGLVFWRGPARALGGAAPPGRFANWIPPENEFLGEPNNLFGENYLVWNHAPGAPGVRGKAGLWNDQLDHSSRHGDTIAGFFVEYGE